jgi:hypothetical protein
MSVPASSVCLAPLLEPESVPEPGVTRRMLACVTRAGGRPPYAALLEALEDGVLRVTCLREAVVLAELHKRDELGEKALYVDETDHGTRTLYVAWDEATAVEDTWNGRPTLA